MKVELTDRMDGWMDLQIDRWIYRYVPEKREKVTLKSMSKIGTNFETNAVDFFLFDL